MWYKYQMRLSVKIFCLTLLAIAVLAGSAQARTVNGCVIRHHTTCDHKDLHGADLRGAVLHHSVLHHINLRNADLSEADLSGADLTNTDLTVVDLTGANLSRTKLAGATITDGALDITGVPQSLPADWELRDGALIQAA